MATYTQLPNYPIHQKFGSAPMVQSSLISSSVSLSPSSKGFITMSFIVLAHVTWIFKDVSKDMVVSKNRGIPKSSILISFSIINHPFWGTIIFGNIHMLIKKGCEIRKFTGTNGCQFRHPCSSYWIQNQWQGSIPPKKKLSKSHFKSDSNKVKEVPKFHVSNSDPGGWSQHVSMFQLIWIAYPNSIMSPMFWG